MRKLRLMVMAHGWLALAPLVLAACGGGDAGPRVVFVSPEDGGTYPADSPVAFEFGIADYELGAVPEEVFQPRAGVGHHHLGLNTDCLAAGEEIPRGDPTWVHFGDATSTIEMMLEPGEHTFVLQLGDDEHVTQAADGLCASVAIRVE